MSSVDRSPLSRREIEIVVAWVRSGFAIAGQEHEPWADRLVAKLRGAWANARDVAEPSEHPPPRDYQVPQHQTNAIDPPHERAGKPTPGDAPVLTPAELDPAQRCRVAVAEIYARYDAQASAMLAALRMRDAVARWGSLVHAHVVGDGELVYAVSDVPGFDAVDRVLLWDPDEDREAARSVDAKERQRVLDGTDPEYAPRERSRGPGKRGKDVRISPGPTQRSSDPSLPQDSDRK